MRPTLLLPQHLTIEFVEQLHAQALALEPGCLDGGAVTVVDGAGAQWLASAVATGWTLDGASAPLARGVALLGLSHLLPEHG
jgi:hypothetical protein